MKEKENFLEVFSSNDFRKWLEKNHDIEKKVFLIINKKHTRKKFPSHRELIEEAICFGWIDTTVKKLDENQFIRTFCKRGKNSRWSDNTISYAKQLISEKRMTPAGKRFYLEGLKKPTHDDGIPKNPEIPEELKKALGKSRKAKEGFEKLSPSARKTQLRWLYRAKMPETKKKRINSIIELAKKKRDLNISTKVNQ